MASLGLQSRLDGVDLKVGQSLLDGVNSMAGRGLGLRGIVPVMRYGNRTNEYYCDLATNDFLCELQYLHSYCYYINLPL